MKRYFPVINFLFLIFIVCLFGCRAQFSVSPNAKIEFSETATESSGRATSTIAITESSSPEPVIDKPTMTSSPIPSEETVSLIPTLPLGDAIESVQDLIDTNGGCLLPCFWGITPGKTTWEEASRIFRPIGIVQDFESDELLFNKYVFFLALKELGQYPNQGYFVENGIVEMITVEDLRAPKYTDLLQLYSDLGAPQEVWITTHATGPTKMISNITVASFYSEKGIAFQQNYGAIVDRNQATSCFDSPSYTYMALWNPALSFSFEDVTNEYFWLSGEFKKYKPLQEATSMDEESFYVAIKSGNDCIQTPNDLWLP